MSEIKRLSADPTGTEDPTKRKAKTLQNILYGVGNIDGVPLSTIGLEVRAKAIADLLEGKIKGPDDLINALFNPKRDGPSTKADSKVVLPTWAYECFGITVPKPEESPLVIQLLRGQGYLGRFKLSEIAMDLRVDTACILLSGIAPWHINQSWELFFPKEPLVLPEGARVLPSWAYDWKQYNAILPPAIYKFFGVIPQDDSKGPKRGWQDLE